MSSEVLIIRLNVYCNSNISLVVFGTIRLYQHSCPMCQIARLYPVSFWKYWWYSCFCLLEKLPVARHQGAEHFTEANARDHSRKASRKSRQMSAGLWHCLFVRLADNFGARTINIYHGLGSFRFNITKNNETLQNSVRIVNISLYSYLTLKFRKRAFSSKSITDTDAPVPQPPAYVILLFW